MLGIPTVADRVAQMVVKLAIEPILDPIFLTDSYAYRPKKSALDAVGATRERCWKYDWVLEFDIKGLFDNIDHELLMRAVRKHVTCKWVLLYIERWLKAPIVQEDGTRVERNCGTPQGGVVSPILANLFLHYSFDCWMARTRPDLPWCRYADDGLVHCRTAQEAEALKAQLQARLGECRLEMHPTKTKVVYCKDGKRRGKYPNVKFDFLGYCFRPRLVRRFRDHVLFCGFNPAVSPSAMKAMRQAIRDLNIRRQTQLSLQDIAQQLNPFLRGLLQRSRELTRPCSPQMDRSMSTARCAASAHGQETTVLYLSPLVRRQPPRWASSAGLLGASVPGGPAGADPSGVAPTQS